MIGSFATRGITMFVGYLYPAYECFKVVEQRRPSVESLRFWCQYWILIALVTVMERFADTFISWIPMYQEAKLAFIIYLFYARRGTAYIYTTFLRPYVASHESEIDQHLNELRTRALDFVAAYWERSSAFMQTKFFEILQYIVAQGHRTAAAQPPPPPPPPPPAQDPPPPPGNYPPPPQVPIRPTGAFYPPALPPGYEASAPPAPAAPPAANFGPAAADAGYNPGFYPRFPMVQSPPVAPQNLHTVIREPIDLEEEEEEIVMRPNGNAAGAVASSSSAARYMTRSRQRATASGNRAR
ncbi:putative HVA22-like protein g [Selaginella moellendorffii]|uniref:putative HVA22-like protein g n=1 Tax=Selaginella moellendorffii TaxID=88036 RepID=UPI000D1C2DC5|nr:putative HVA22-like protein g [Selaginella moellendorffii]|eukprot:XP_002963256.2 putative HVA22-like protein g [Selaginella moellendorffii]